MSFTPFKITKITSHSQTELLDKLKEVVMLKDRNARPYANATLSVVDMDFDHIRPAQRYVLADGLLKVQHLTWELSEYGLDPLALDGYLSIWTNQSPDPIDLLPPIVESTLEANGSHINILNDGMHRMFAGYLAWKRPKILLAENIPSEYPYYAYALPGPAPWDNIQILEGDRIPAGFIKKWHRTQDNKQLYRDFNSAFQNVGGPRGQG